MKIILSRKGFDSGYGGYPSPILPDNRLISLPIAREKNSNCYSDLKLDVSKIEGLKSEINTYYDLMTELGYKNDEGISEIKYKINQDKLTKKTKWNKLTEETTCHLDPDIRKEVLKRKDGWTGCFGQANGAQTHLKDQVNKGDLFLFFGWFRKTKIEEGKLSFDKYEPDLHVIFGYLQIENIEKVDHSFKAPEWMENHPHTSKEERKEGNNTIYVAREKLSLNGFTSLPGAGIFDFDESLVLTKKYRGSGNNGYLSRSKWYLPEFFRDNKIKISYHNEKSWKPEGYFQSVAPDQEFVIDAEDDEKVVEWAKEKIKIKERNILGDD
jgi:hypothetical protein